MLKHRFVCLLETEADNYNRYIVAPVSFARYRELITNMIPIRHVFTKSEAGGVFTIKLDSNITSEIALHSIDDIESMQLPIDSEFLDIKESYTSNEILLNSYEKNVPILQKSLEKKGEHRQYIYAKELAKENMKFQNVFDGIANDKIKNKEIRSNEQKRKVKKDSQVPVFGFYAASFGQRIEGVDFPLIGEKESGFAEFIKTYFELINISENSDNSYFEKHKNALIALKGYYKSLLAHGFSIKLSAATPNRELMKMDLSREQIVKKYNYLNHITGNDMEQIKLTGKFIRIAIDKKTFQFRLENNDIIDGKFDEDFDESIFDFANTITILVDKEVLTSRIGDTKSNYTLLLIE